jgi:class 3 adenylate cyclase
VADALEPSESLRLAFAGGAESLLAADERAVAEFARDGLAASTFRAFRERASRHGRLRSLGSFKDTSGEALVRTFLLADVRGFTRYTRERGDEAASELARRLRLGGDGVAVDASAVASGCALRASIKSGSEGFRAH